MSNDLQRWQLEIIGLITGFDEYRGAAKIAIEHGEDGVLFAMQAMHKAGFNDALETVMESARSQRKREVVNG